MAKLVTNDLVTLTNETSTVNTINNNFAAVDPTAWYITVLGDN